MNRREFVKALASIPLLGLLVKVPKVEQLVVDDEVLIAYKAYGHFYSDAVAGPGVPHTLDIEVVEGAAPHAGRTIFVDLVSGDDANDGLSPETPVTWEKAWYELAEPRQGDIIISFYPEEEL